MLLLRPCHFLLHLLSIFRCRRRFFGSRFNFLFIGPASAIPQLPRQHLAGARLVAVHPRLWDHFLLIIFTLWIRFNDSIIVTVGQVLVIFRLAEAPNAHAAALFVWLYAALVEVLATLY